MAAFCLVETLKELSDAVVPLAEDPRAKLGDSHLKTRAVSPPKLAATQALRQALDAATALGGCNSQVIGEAQAKLMQAQELRAKAKRDAEKSNKRKPGEKSEEEKLAQMEKKLIRQRARGR